MIAIKMFFLLGLPFLLFFASVGMNVYIVLRDLDKVLDNFKASVIISSYGSRWGKGSLYTRYALVCVVMGSVVFPSQHIRNGTLDAEEFARFPSAMKCRMKIYFSLLVGTALCFFSTAIVLIFLRII